MEVPRRWLRVKRNDAFGELPWRVATCRQTVGVATCRQTVETLLAPLVHRLAVDGYSKRAKGKRVTSSDPS